MGGPRLSLYERLALKKAPRNAVETSEGPSTVNVTDLTEDKNPFYSTFDSSSQVPCKLLSVPSAT
ncbi:hypothetical protein IC582_027785 [Cucumis melo]